MDFDPFFVYYTVMTGSEDQKLDLSIWTDIHTHTHIHIYIACFIYMYFVMYLLYIFMQNVLSSNARYN